MILTVVEFLICFDSFQPFDKKIKFLRLQTNNLKCEKELDQNKRKSKNENENLKELNTKLEKKLKACARDNELLSSDLGRTSDRLR